MDYILSRFKGSAATKKVASIIRTSPKILSCELIDNNRTLNVGAIEEFENRLKLVERGRQFDIVSIIGPQSSGKSTLLNHLYGTNFKEMDACQGRSQTTRGIWLATRCPDNDESLTLVMDLEGTDSAENEVQKRLPDSGKINLIIVVRDTPIEVYNHKISLERLKLQVIKSIQTIWDSTSKRAVKKDILLQVFNVEFVALPSYELQNKFKNQVECLRHQINKLIATNRGDAAPPSVSLSCKMQPTWKLITENKDLALPPQSVINANYRCQQIADERFKDFTKNKDWLEMKEAIRSDAGLNGKKLRSIIEKCLSGFDAEAEEYAADIQTYWRKMLKDKLHDLVQPTAVSFLRHIHYKSVEEFKESFKSLDDFEICKENCIKQFMDRCAAIVMIDQQQEKATWTTKLLRDLYQVKLQEALLVPVEEQLQIANEETWSSIRKIYQRETGQAIVGFKNDLSQLDIDKSITNELLAELKKYANILVDTQMSKMAKKLFTLMCDKFKRKFYHDGEKHVPSYWFNKEDVKLDKQKAYSECIKLICVLAANQLNDEFDNLEQDVRHCLFNDMVKETDSWNKIPKSKTIITPSQIIQIREKFTEEADKIVNSADVRHAKHNLEKCQRRLRAFAGILDIVRVVSSFAEIVQNITEFF